MQNICNMNAAGGTQCVRPENGPGTIRRPLICHVCGHRWSSRKETGPDRCPGCRSTIWSRNGIGHNKCMRCGHEWVSNDKRPPKCPRCRAAKWEEPARKLECKRCGHVWNAQTDTPKTCPSCRTKKWDEPSERLVCPKCGRTRPKNANSRVGLCTVCDRNTHHDVCAACGASHTLSRGKRIGTCPVCGAVMRGEGTEKQADITHRTDESIADRYGWDADRLSAAAGTDRLRAEIFLCHCRKESVVGIARRMDVSFEAAMNSIKTIRSGAGRDTG